MDAGMGDGEQLGLVDAVDGVAADVPDLTPLGAQNHVPRLEEFDEACKKPIANQ